jgi:hypothetical protein
LKKHANFYYCAFGQHNNKEFAMSEFDELIACVANEVQHSKEIDESCRKTLKDYQCLDTIDPGGGGGSGSLKMIAWDRS